MAEEWAEGLDGLRSQIDQSILGFLDETAQKMPELDHPGFGRVYRSAYAYLRNGGRRMHGLAMLLAFRATRGERVDAFLRVAAGFQLYHHHTMVHDDIYDEDPARRGSATVHQAFADWFSKRASTPIPSPADPRLFATPDARRGAIAGWMQGKVVHALAFEAIASAQFPREALLEVIRALSWHDVYDNAGQFKDVFHERSPELTPDQSIGIAALKTGRLFGVCTDAAGRLSGATGAQVAALREWATELGVAYQLQDDLEDLEPNSEKGLGRGVGTDVRSAKPTLLLALALQNAASVDRQTLREWLRTPAATLGVSQFREILERSGAIEGCRREVQVRVERGCRALRRADPPLSSTALALMDAFGRYFISAEYWSRPLPDPVSVLGDA